VPGSLPDRRSALSVVKDDPEVLGARGAEPEVG